MPELWTQENDKERIPPNGEFAGDDNPNKKMSVMRLQVDREVQNKRKESSQ